MPNKIFSSLCLLVFSVFFSSWSFSLGWVTSGEVGPASCDANNLGNSYPDCSVACADRYGPSMPQYTQWYSVRPSNNISGFCEGRYCDSDGVMGIDPETCQCPDDTTLTYDDTNPNGYCKGNVEQDECVNQIMSNGGNGSYYQDSDGNYSCQIGPNPQPQNPDQCDGVNVGATCYNSPTDDKCSSGQAYGTVNGQPICVSSPGSDSNSGPLGPNSLDNSTNATDDGNNTRNNNSPLGPQTSTRQTASSTTTTQNPDGSSTTSTTTTTETTTTTTSLDPDVLSQLVSCDQGFYAEFESGCDTTLQCTAVQANSWGVCVDIPTVTETTVEVTEETTSTTTNPDNTTTPPTTTTTTNTTPSTTTSNDNGNNGGGASSNNQPSETEDPNYSYQCDPTSASYLDCLINGSFTDGDAKGFSNAADQALEAAETEYDELISSIKATAEGLLSVNVSESGTISPAEYSIFGVTVDFSWYKFRSSLAILGNIFLACAAILAAFIILRK